MSQGTRSDDYSSTYYNDAHLGGYDNYTWDNEEYRNFFLGMADRIVGMTNPRTTLDVGCARGLLVQALAIKGVDSKGLDISEHAVESAHPDVRDRLTVASAKEPFSGRYDLVTCIEVLEHMSPRDAQAALDNMVSVTDRVLFSSSPGDHDEPTHVNTHPTAHWAAWFAERGFFRRTDVDLTFLSPWAVLFERADLTLHTLTQRYEQQFAMVNTELQEKRASLLESHRRIGMLNEKDGGPDGPLAQREAEVLEARHALLINRDHIVGLEAEVARLKRENRRLDAALERTRSKLESVRGRLEQSRSRVANLTRRNEQLSAQPPAGSRGRAAVRRALNKIAGGSR